jgi:PTH1 family peptidyl-tRNA hydrolase
MSWLQKRPQVSNPSLFYTVGLNKTILICGLGNPGEEYVSTRHNIGYRSVEEFTKATEEFSGWVVKKDLKCQLNTAQLGDKRVFVIKPLTFMNDSGQALSLITNFYKIEAQSILVVHDELDINFGQIRTRLGGTDAGHNGIKSVTEALGEDNYGRVKIGIGPKKPAQIDSKDFVLQNFSKEEQKELPNLFREVTAILTEHIYSSNEIKSETRSFLL